MQQAHPGFAPHKSDLPVENSPADVITIGSVKGKIFWPVLLVAFLLLGGLLWQAANGNIAIAANCPLPFTFQADAFDLRNSTLVLGLSNSGNNVPVAIITDNATATNLRISKQVSLPFIGPVTFLLTAGDRGVPARLDGTRTDVQALSSSVLHVQNQVTSTNARFGIRITASDQQFFNLTIKAPYLSVDSATFPNLHLAVFRS